jgi:hypothetical protein
MVVAQERSMGASQDLKITGEPNLGEEHFSAVALRAGRFLFFLGLVQLLTHSFELRREQRGRMRARLSIRNWSFRAVWPGMVMMFISILLLGGLHFFGGP